MGKLGGVALGKGEEWAKAALVGKPDSCFLDLNTHTTGTLSYVTDQENRSNYPF